MRLADLPLLLANVPLAVTDWLRQAGVPVQHVPVELQNHHGDTTPSRGHDKTSPLPVQASEPSGRFLLFDSRKPVATEVTQWCRRWGLTRIDIAKLVYDVPHGCVAGPFLRLRGQQSLVGNETNSARSTFLTRLKSAIERGGGVWARIGDFPHPWRGVLCIDGALSGHSDFSLPSANQHQRLSSHTLKRQWQSGQSLSLRGTPPQRSQAVLRTVRQHYPLLWAVRKDEFGDWWQTRSKVQFSLSQQSTVRRWSATNLPTESRAVLELWQSQHVAWLPLDANVASGEFSGLVLQRQEKRHPAGFTAWWPDGFTLNSESPLHRAMRRDAS